MNVSLTEELERKVEDRVRSGLYGSASEVVREALRLFFRYDEARMREVGDDVNDVRKDGPELLEPPMKLF